MKAIQKILVAILAAMFLIALSFTAAFASENRNGEASLSLLMPETYEQYLELTAPSDIAVSEQYIAIADKPTLGSGILYLLDKTAEPLAYRAYTHNTGTLSSLNLYQADGKTYLFFLDTDNKLYYLDCSATELKATLVNEISAHSFIISGQDVYYAKKTDANANIYHASISFSDDNFTFDLDESTPLNGASTLSAIVIAFSSYNNTVYLAADKQLYSCSPTAIKKEYETTFGVLSFAVIGASNKELIYASQDYHLYFKDTDQHMDRDYSVVKLFGGDVYIAAGDTVLQYNLQSQTFTDYLIGKYADRNNRINNASNISFYGETLAIADTGNDRVSVLSANSVKTHALADVRLVCAGETNALAVSPAGTYLIDYAGTQAPAEIDQAPSDIVSATYAFGMYYLIDQSGNTASIDARTHEVKKATPAISNPVGISADLYGNIYVLSSEGHVNRYTAEQFLGDGQGSERIHTFNGISPIGLFTDYEGNVFVLTSDKIVCYDAETKSTADMALPFTDTVYSTSPKSALDFAFDFENGTVYVLSDGFMVTADLGASAPASLKNIAADGLYAALNGSAAGTSGLLVDVPEQSVVIELQASAIRQDTAVLPYAGFSRTDSARTGVKICEIDAGTVVAFYRYSPDGDTTEYAREYSLCLVPGETNPLDGYYTAQSFGARTTNETALLRFPTMHIGDTQNAIERLARGTSVTVLGKVSLPAPATGGYGLDIDHYYVRTSVNGQTVFGYLPCGYVVEDSASNGGGYATTEFVYRYVKRNESITLYRNDQPIELSDQERVKMYGEPNENGEVYVTYTDENGTWSGYVPEDCLFAASPAATIILVVVMLVTAAVLVSACYLVLRKPPMLQ